MTDIQKTIIGRAELLSIISPKLEDIPAKTDTGAFTSSIHATDIRQEVKDGKTVLCFNLLTGHPAFGNGGEFCVEKFSRTNVENSFGVSQERYVVDLEVSLGDNRFVASFTLADRSQKVFPILLGRTFINGRFLVDTDIARVDRKELKSKIKEWLEKDQQED